MGDSRKRQVRRRVSDLLLPQRIDPSVRTGHLRQEPESKPIRRREKGGAQDDCSDQSRTQQEEIAVMTKESKLKTKKRTPKSTAAGRSLLTSLGQALAYARGEHVPGLRVTHVQVDRPAPVDLLAIRQNLGLSQSRFATRFGFTAATIRNWEQGRTRPDGPARILLAVIAHHPDAVEDALRKAG